MNSRSKTENQKKADILSTFVEVEKPLRQYLKRFLIRNQDIEDVVQEAFIRSYDAEKKQKIQAPKSFLYKVAKNLALSEINRKSNQLTTCMEDFELSEVIDTRANIEDNISRQQELQFYINALRQLPAQCQKVFVMCKVYGFSHKEISSKLGISVSTVEKHLVKGLQRCRKYMQENRMGGHINDDTNSETVN